MHLIVSTFSKCKDGSIPEQNQDVACPVLIKPRSGQIAKRSEFDLKTTTPRFFAISDGASEGLLSGEWARILLNSVKKSGPDADLLDAINRAKQVWKRFKRQRSSNFTKPLTTLPKWLEFESLAQGAFATICLLWISDTGKFTGMAVGDSCIFHVRNLETHSSWPLGCSQDFNNSPTLIGSNDVTGPLLQGEMTFFEGILAQEDRLVFATDALAAWVFGRIEGGEDPWRTLFQLDTQFEDEYEKFVREERLKGLLRNDDTTLMKIIPSISI